MEFEQNPLQNFRLRKWQTKPPINWQCAVADVRDLSGYLLCWSKFVESLNQADQLRFGITQEDIFDDEEGFFKRRVFQIGDTVVRVHYSAPNLPDQENREIERLSGNKKLAVLISDELAVITLQSYPELIPKASVYADRADNKFNCLTYDGGVTTYFFTDKMKRYQLRRQASFLRFVMGKAIAAFKN